MSTAPHPGPEIVCEICGAPEATRLADEALCVDCYAERSACCADKADSGCSRSHAPDGPSPEPRP